MANMYARCRYIIMNRVIYYACCRWWLSWGWIVCNLKIMMNKLKLFSMHVVDDGEYPKNILYAFWDDGNNNNKYFVSACVFETMHSYLNRL